MHALRFNNKEKAILNSNYEALLFEKNEKLCYFFPLWVKFYSSYLMIFKQQELIFTFKLIGKNNCNYTIRYLLIYIHLTNKMFDLSLKNTMKKDLYIISE